MKYEVALERKCTIMETALVAVEAASEAEARRAAKVMIENGATDNLDWEPCDTNYSSTRIDEITAA